MHPHNNKTCLATWQWLLHKENFEVKKIIDYKIWGINPNEFSNLFHNLLFMKLIILKICSSI